MVCGIMTVSEQTEPKSGRSILILDDEPYVLALLKVIFSKAGFQVLMAKNGKEGLQILEQRNPDIILSDVMMPEMNGYEFLNRVQQNERFKQIPFIFLTAKDKPIDIEVGMKLGVDDYIVKGANPQTIIDKVHAVLSRQSNVQ
jgi:DNA-binding response OmpR family regulator